MDVSGMSAQLSLPDSLLHTSTGWVGGGVGILE